MWNFLRILLIIQTQFQSTSKRIAKLSPLKKLESLNNIVNQSDIFEEFKEMFQKNCLSNLDIIDTSPCKD